MVVCKDNVVQSFLYEWGPISSVYLEVPDPYQQDDNFIIFEAIITTRIWENASIRCFDDDNVPLGSSICLHTNSILNNTKTKS